MIKELPNLLSGNGQIFWWFIRKCHFLEVLLNLHCKDTIPFPFGSVRVPFCFVYLHKSCLIC